jgi:ketosteroid isomerase-like protein
MTREAGEVSLAQQLWDIELIKQLKAKYFRYIDTKDWSGFADLFTADCIHYLPEGAPTPTLGNAQYLASLQRMLAHAVTTHHGQMPEITLLGATEAEGIWSMFDDVRSEPPGEQPRRIQSYGHYFETYRKCEDGRWRISSKRNVRQRLDHPALTER